MGYETFQDCGLMFFIALLVFAKKNYFIYKEIGVEYVTQTAIIHSQLSLLDCIPISKIPLHSQGLGGQLCFLIK